MTRLCILKPEGTEALRRYVVDLRSGAVPSSTISELLSERFCDQFEPPVEVGKKRFKNKLKMADHLRKAFRQADVDWRSVAYTDGLWNWLSILWFNELTEEKSKVLATPHYVLDQGRYHYRHLVRSAFLTYCIHGEKTGLLYMPVSKWGDLWEQIVGRGYLFNSPSLMSLIHWLCWSEKNRPRRGAVGIVREIWRLLNQFKRTYDVDSMDPSQILRLIPQLAGFVVTPRRT